MKRSILLSVVLLLTVLTSCRKLAPFPISNAPTSDFKQQGLSDDFFATSASFNGNQNANEIDRTLSIPFNTQTKLRVGESHRKVHDIQWNVNGKQIASGNDATITIPEIGVYTLNVKFKETESGTAHNKAIKLYVYKEVNLSAMITPNKNICGEVALGITTESSSAGKFGPMYLTNSVQQVCTTDTKKTANIARVPIKVYDANTTISIDLIEPNKTYTTIRGELCFLFLCFGGSSTKTVVNPLQVYQTDQFSPSSTKNLKPGQYSSGGTVLTIE